MEKVRGRVSPELEEAFLQRLGLEAEPPSIEALFRLHRRMVERIPYETMWLHASEKWGVDPLEALTRIATQGRGGYCFHLNGALAEVLESLGYEVSRHAGAVYGPDGPNASSADNHVVITVSGLPCEENHAGAWYLDAGLGDALHEPLPLVASDYVQAPFRLVLARTPSGNDGWNLDHDPAGGFVGMCWTDAEVEMVQFAPQHHWLSTSPDSPFTQVAMAERRDATGVDVIRGLLIGRVGERTTWSEPLRTRSEWISALADGFGLRLEHSEPAAVDHLWNQVLRAHRSWEGSGHHEDHRLDDDPPVAGA